MIVAPSTTSVKSKIRGEIFRIIPNLADPSGGFALLDFPNYANVGDSLIWLGETSFFRECFGVTPSYVAIRDEFDAASLRRACPKGPIYLSGGGNFGDIWPKFQAFRQRVLEEFPDRPVIQLPQSIHFREAANLQRTRDFIARHPDFTLLVRDQPSYDLAKAEFDCAVHLCPDMAFALKPFTDPLRPVCDAVFLLRQDIEKTAGRGEPSAALRNIEIVDWIEDDAMTKLARHTVLPAARRLAALTANYRALYAAFEWLAILRLRQGRRALSRGRIVVTDRLHAHIFSLLLGIPHVVVDNSYGKVGRFIEKWTHADPLVRTAPSLATACDYVSENA
ncbi:exopolysaccharide biosynthesis protein [Terrihabitans soli]|uniref:Exopolysaccharide biosynthesis protein n=1 Tax=Terrihabitans soli TaxID=708113 RepID=A0A6S6QZ75_9HYPH|nr:polysaccharide pyruvyl transferase family protein [Terrihabitans soli]BCJ91928.1 exopolysaccharide biosynthesis protein [Terrihabitans soli]